MSWVICIFLLVISVALLALVCIAWEVLKAQKDAVAMARDVAELKVLAQSALEATLAAPKPFC